MKENAYVDKRQNIWWAWKDYLLKRKNALNTMSGINRWLLLTEAMMRIRGEARDKEIEMDF